MSSTTTPSDLQSIELADELRTVLKRLVRRLRQEGAEQAGDLSLHQTMLLARIEAHPGIGVAELARQEHLRVPTMSAHVKLLEQSGLVRREPDPQDRRRAGLHLSDAGRQMLDRLWSRRRDWLAGRLARLPAEGTAALRLALRHLQEISE